MEYAGGDLGDLTFPSRCHPSPPTGLLNASCAVHAALNCTYVHPHTALACELDPAGWGTGFRVRVIVKGLASAWSEDTIAYAQPTLVKAEVLWAYGAPTGPALSPGLHPNGGSLLSITGFGLSPVSQLTLTLGGVVLPRPYASSFSSIANIGATGAPPAFTLQGGPSALPSLRFAPLQTIVVCTPPGVGAVILSATLGNRSSLLNVTYTLPSIPTLDSFSKFDPNDVKGISNPNGLRFALSIYGISPCAVCLSNLAGYFPECDPSLAA